MLYKLLLAAVLSTVAIPALAQYDQPFQANVNGIDRLFVPGNAPRSPVSIVAIAEATAPYSVNQGWVRISNTKLDVIEVQGLTPSNGSVPTGAGNAGDLINTGSTGVFYWSGLGNLVETLTVRRSLTLTRTSNACGVATFSPTATRPLNSLTINGSPVQFLQLPQLAASYCRSGILFRPQ